MQFSHLKPSLPGMFKQKGLKHKMHMCYVLCIFTIGCKYKLFKFKVVTKYEVYIILGKSYKIIQFNRTNEKNI